MPKYKNLNGLPHNIVRSLFGTERYYQHGYMADWLFFAARELKLEDAEIDILNVCINPEKLNLSPLLHHIEDLKCVIEKELTSNGFKPEYIVSAKIKVNFPNHKVYKRTFYCYPSLVGTDGRSFESGRMIETAYEDYFNPFNITNYPDEGYDVVGESLYNRLKKFFGWKQ